MKRTVLLVTLLGAGLGLAATAALISAGTDTSKDQVVDVIKASYLNGAFNDLDTATMRKGFHPAFEIHGVQNGDLRRYPIDEWIASIEKRKAAPDFDPADQKWDYKLAMVDVTGDAAMAKIELSKDGTHIYTDYLSLLKLKDGWKITDKIYHRHAEPATN